jgi:hypothetical protein
MSATTQRRGTGAARGGSEFRIGFLVHDVSRLRQTVFDQAMKPHGVTRAQWWALELTSMTTRHPAGSCAHQTRNLSRLSERLVNTRACASTACTWITRLERSTPTRAGKPRVILSTDFPFHMAAD